MPLRGIPLRPGRGGTPEHSPGWPRPAADKLPRVASDLGTSKKNVIATLATGYAGAARFGACGVLPPRAPGGLTSAEAADMLRVDVAIIEQLAAPHELPGRMVGGS